MGRQAGARAVGSEELGGKAFDRDLDHVRSLRRPFRADLAQQVTALKNGRIDALGEGDVVLDTREGVVDVDAGIKLVVVELIVAERGEKRPGAVFGELAIVVVGKIGQVGRIEGEAVEQTGGHPHEGTHVTPASRLARVLYGAQHETGAPTEQVIKGRRAKTEGAEDQRQVVGLADIAHHLGGVNEVVDGDKIEPRAEFVPENQLGGGIEQQSADRNHAEEMQQKLDRAMIKSVARQNRQQQHDGQGSKTSGAEVEKQAPEKGSEKAGVPGGIAARHQQEAETGGRLHGDEKQAEKQNQAQPSAQESSNSHIVYL